MSRCNLPAMTAQPRSDAYHHGDLPNALLAAVGEIVAERGVRDVSLREAARRAGVSHSAPAHHFGDKEGMLAAFCRQGFALLEHELRSAAEAHRDLPPLERFAKDGEAYVRFAVNHPAHFEVMFRSGLNKPDHPDLHAQANSTFSALMERVVELQEAGYYTDSTPDEVAVYFWSLAHGLASLWVDGQFDAVFEDADPAALVGYAVTMATREAQTP